LLSSSKQNEPHPTALFLHFKLIITIFSVPSSNFFINKKIVIESSSSLCKHLFTKTAICKQMFTQDHR